MSTLLIVLLCLLHLFACACCFFAGCWAMHCGRTMTSPLPAVPSMFKRAEPDNGETEQSRHPRAGIPSRVGN